MTKYEMALEAIAENPFISNGELGEVIDMTEKHAAIYVSKMKTKGYIEDVGKYGKRELVVLREYRKVAPKSFKAGVYEDMVSVFLEDFGAAEGYAERLEIGRMIFKILEKI